MGKSVKLSIAALAVCAVGIILSFFAVAYLVLAAFGLVALIPGIIAIAQKGKQKNELILSAVSIVAGIALIAAAAVRLFAALFFAGLSDKANRTN